MLVLDRSVPASLQIAACAWVLVGVAHIFTALTFMGLTYSTGLSAFLVAVGLMFVGMGVQTLTGRLRDPLLCSVLSVLPAFVAVRDLDVAATHSLGNLLLLVLLFAAGLLSAFGRNAYRSRTATVGRP